jgi:hypothetical protein
MFQWPRITRIVIVGEVDHAAIIDEIGAQMRKTGEWAVDEGTSSNGFPELTLRNDDAVGSQSDSTKAVPSSGWMLLPPASPSREGSSAVPSTEARWATVLARSQWARGPRA